MPIDARGVAFSDDDLAALPKIMWNSKDFINLWETDRWDGPMAGCCRLTYADAWFYYFCVELGHDVEEVPPTIQDEGREPSRSPRRFVMFELTPEQMKDEHYWHNQFKTHVRDGNQYKGTRQDWMTNFYEPYDAAPRLPLAKEQAKYVLEW